jgi:hypothetical protein
MARQEDCMVMLRAAKHLEAHGERPFAAAQGDKNAREWGDKKGVTREHGNGRGC